MKLVSVSRLLTIVVLVIGAFSAFAASPANGTLSGKNETTWDGGPFYAPNPLTTAGAVKQVPCDVGQPMCDSFRLTVPAGTKEFLVAIAPAAGFETDDYDLYVYNDKGIRVADDAGEDGYESTIVGADGSAYYDVRVQAYIINPGSGYHGVAQIVKKQPVDTVRECLEAVPQNFQLPVIDSGQKVDLSVFLLLDGTDANVAAATMQRAAESYRPLNVTLRLVGTRAVSFSSLVSEELIASAKATMGGKPPKGVDLVGVFTTKEMQAATGGAGTVVGQADCIGGIRWDDTSFFVVSDIRDIENPTGGQTGTLNSLGLNPNVDATAEVMAHEIGHLMGAHHHYFNCVEGNLTSAGPTDLSPCTLMFPAVNFASLNFSTVEGATVRGHALNHAMP